MNNIVLISYSPDIDSNILRDRIQSLGQNYNFFNNNWFVRTSLSAKEVYDKISVGEFDKSSILVIEVKTNVYEYWGRMNSELWDWFKANES